MNRRDVEASLQRLRGNRLGCLGVTVAQRLLKTNRQILIAEILNTAPGQIGTADRLGRKTRGKGRRADAPVSRDRAAFETNRARPLPSSDQGAAFTAQIYSTASAARSDAVKPNTRPTRASATETIRLARLHARDRSHHQLDVVAPRDLSN
jgi:hypothetical protein